MKIYQQIYYDREDFTPEEQKCLEENARFLPLVRVDECEAREAELDCGFLEALDAEGIEWPYSLEEKVAAACLTIDLARWPLHRLALVGRQKG